MSTAPIFPRWTRNTDDQAILPPGSLVLDPEDGTTYRKGPRGDWWLGGSDTLDVGALPPMTAVLLYVPPAHLSPILARRLGDLDVYDPMEESRKEWETSAEWLADPTL